MTTKKHDALSGASLLTDGLDRNDMPSETIVEVPEFNFPCFRERLAQKKEFCMVFERKEVRKLCNLHTLSKLHSRTDRNFRGFAAGKAANRIWPVEDAAIFHGDSAKAATNIVCISFYFERWQLAIILDLDARLGIKFFAFVGDSLDNQLWRECQPCHIQC